MAGNGLDLQPLPRNGQVLEPIVATHQLNELNNRKTNNEGKQQWQ
jgi:hypothetical protein